MRVNKVLNYNFPSCNPVVCNSENIQFSISELGFYLIKFAEFSVKYVWS